MNNNSASTNSESKHLTDSIFQWMPSIAIIINIEGEIVEINQQAINFFRFSKEQLTDKITIADIAVDNIRAMNLIHELISENPTKVKKIIFKRLDKSIACVDISACYVPENKNLIFIQFIDNSPKSNILYTTILQTFKQEILQLKPYLNKPGKEMMEAIIGANTLQKIVSKKSTFLTNSELLNDDRIRSIIRLFPDLTYNELVLCEYLSLRLTIEDIATITGKTENSLRVSLHRIVKKVSISNGRELIRKLEDI